MTSDLTPPTNTIPALASAGSATLATPSERLMPHLAPYRWFRKHELILSDHRFTRPFRVDPRNPAAHRGAALALIRAIPPADDLDRARAMFQNAVSGRAELVDVAAVVSAMLEGKANFRADQRAGYVGVFIDVLTFDADVEGFSIEAVATAALINLRTSTFVPELAEFLPLVRDQSRLFARVLDAVLKLADNRDAAEDMLRVGTGDATAIALDLSDEAEWGLYDSGDRAGR